MCCNFNLIKHFGKSHSRFTVVFYLVLKVVLNDVFNFLLLLNIYLFFKFIILNVLNMDSSTGLRIITCDNLKNELPDLRAGLCFEDDKAVLDYMKR